jgi:hypothetical protein
LPRAQVIAVSLRPVFTSGTVACDATKRTAGPAFAGSSPTFAAVSRGFGTPRNTSSDSSAAGNTPSSAFASTASSPRSPMKNAVPSGKTPWHLITLSWPAASARSSNCTPVIPQS